MDISALLTSAGINIALCVVLLSLYSILRKQPSLVSVYFGQRIAQLRSKCHDSFSFDRLVPSASWILKAWEASEEEIFAIGGLDAVVFLRMVVFSIRILSIAAIMCIFLVLPLNYFGQEMQHKQIPSESLDVFTITNVKEGSRWLWAHCLTLYIISWSACVLLYFEYKSITKLRLVHVTGSPLNPSYFTVLVRAIPWSSEVPYSESVSKFFTNYYASSYLSHQMVYRSGTVQKLVGDAEKMYRMLKSNPVQQLYGSSLRRCGLCGGTGNSFRMLPGELEDVDGRSGAGDSSLREKECAAALIFFRTRYAALVASQALQSPNPMLWVTDLAPEPQDIYWTNLCVPYRLLWIRRVATFLASILFMISFLLPVAFVNGLLRLDMLQRMFPFLRGILRRKFMTQLVTGYLPSVVMMLFLYTVPPIMMLFSTVEGSISRSGRKKSACTKVLYFLIWNVFFANIMSGTVIDQLAQLAIDKLAKISPKDVLNQLSVAVPSMARFFMTYVLTSGWASLSCELMQPFGLLCNLFYRFILRNKSDTSYETLSFPYHTEVPRVLLFLLLGFTYSILAPLVLPFLLVYFFLAYLVYRNQFLNVYIKKYQTGGLYWPVVHNTTIFSLVLSQVIALGVFGLKHSTVASSLTIPLIICTLLFNEYCKQKFYPLFKSNAAQVFIEMDRQDEESGKVEEMHQQLLLAYCQFTSTSIEPCKNLDVIEIGNGDLLQDTEDITSAKKSARVHGSSLIERSHSEIKDLSVQQSELCIEPQGVDKIARSPV